MNDKHYAHLRNVRVSEHFTAYEVVNSNTYPNLVQIPTPETMYHASAFACAVLEPIREFAYGGKPVSINSWYRNTLLNNAVGGVANSVHKMYCRLGNFVGVAVDLTGLPDMAAVFMKLADAAFLRKVPLMKKVIYYPDRNFIHVNSDTGAGKAPVFELSLTKGKYEWVSHDEARDIKRVLKEKFNIGG